jgi:hypothetical protein
MNTERLKGWLSSSSKLVAASAQLAKRQAELATLNNVTLPKLYHAIGKRIIDAKNLPPELVPHREKIRELEAAIATKLEEPKSEPASGFTAKAKQFAQQAAAKTAKATADAATTLKVRSAYIALGRQAIEKYGPKSLPPDLRDQHAALVDAQNTLAGEITSLKREPGKGVVSPARLALAGSVLVLVLGLWCVRRATSWVFSSSLDSSAANAAAASLFKDSSDASTETASPTTGGQKNEDDENSEAQTVANSSNDPVLRTLLGDTSSHYTEYGFKGISLGQSFESVTATTPLFTSPHRQPSVFGDRPPDVWSTLHCQFDERRGLVCLSKTYQGSLDDYRNEILKMFGRTDKPFVTRVLNRARPSRLIQCGRYTFPSVLVEVFRLKVAGTTFTPSRDEVTVTILDRAYAVDLLRRSIESKRQCMRWIKTATSRVAGDDVSQSTIPALVGSKSVSVAFGGADQRDFVGVGLIDDRAREDMPSGLTPGEEYSRAFATAGVCRAFVAPSLTSEVTFKCGKYSGLSQPECLRQGEVDSESPQPKAEALRAIAFLNRLNREATRLLMHEYFPSRDGLIDFVENDPEEIYEPSFWDEWRWKDAEGGVWRVSYAEDDSARLVYEGRKSL